jgi:hypothetical protein
VTDFTYIAGDVYFVHIVYNCVVVVVVVVVEVAEEAAVVLQQLQKY